MCSGGKFASQRSISGCRCAACSVICGVEFLGQVFALIHLLVFASMTRRLSLLNQIFKPLHPETADIDLAFAVDDLLRQRLPDGGGVFKSMA